MWIIYNRITGKIASAIDEPRNGYLLTKFKGFEKFDWDAVFLDEFPDDVDANDCRYINGELIHLGRSYITIEALCINPDEDGIITVEPGAVIQLKAKFFNGWGRQVRTHGTILWRNNRGLIKPKKAKVSGKMESYAQLEVPRENIKMAVGCSIVGFKPGDLFITIE